MATARQIHKDKRSSFSYIKTAIFTLSTVALGMTTYWWKTRHTALPDKEPGICPNYGCDEGPVSSFTTIYKSLSYTPVCPAITNPLTFESVHSDPYVLTKVEIEPSYAKKLTKRNQLAKRLRAIQILQNFAGDEETENKINDVLKSENFRIEIVDKFPGEPAGTFNNGRFTIAKNLVQILVPDVDRSNMVAPTLTHESYGHASIATLKSQGATISMSKDLGQLLGEPFENDAEHQSLQNAINADDNFIIKDFRKMHSKALKNKLSGSEKRKYDLMTSALADYQPRIAGEFFHIRPELQDLEINRLKAVGTIKIKPHGQTLYIKDFIKTKQGIVVDGNFVKDLSDTVSAFILDTNHRVLTQRKAYQRHVGSKTNELKYVATTEAYAEIMANPKLIVEYFYPQVSKYDRQFSHKVKCRQRFTDKDDEITNTPALRL